MGDQSEAVSRARALLARAHVTSENELGAQAVELAGLLLLGAREATTSSERRRARALAARLDSPSSQTFSTILTNRLHRGRDAARLVRMLQRVIARSEPLGGLSKLDELQLLALTQCGTWLPELTVLALGSRVQREAEPYVVDASLAELSGYLAERQSQGVSINLNALGEETLGEAEAKRHLATYLELAGRDDVKALSVKLSNVDSQLNLLAFEQTVERVSLRLRPILERAARGEEPKLVYFDMEAFRDLELSLETFLRLALASGLEHAPLGIALQAYLPESGPALERVFEASRERVARGGVALRVRLVKGANLAMENVEASQHRWDVPVFPSKADVDANYKRLLRRALGPEQAKVLRVGVASHNVFDIAHALLLAEQRGARSQLEIEMLEGMAAPLSRVVAELSGHLLLYAPAVEPEHFPAAISYLVRRFDENAAAENFLRHAFAMEPGDASFRAQASHFLRSLESSHEPVVTSLRHRERSKFVLEGPVPSLPLADRRPFENASDTDFTRADNRVWLERNLSGFRAATWLVQPQIAGEDVPGSEDDGFDPSRPNVAAYRVEWASPARIEQALATAEAARSSWRPRRDRPALLRRVASELESVRGQLIAAILLDAGKRVVEADIEVSEAVDFARYYAASFEHLELEFETEPLGTVVVTPPWNFPLAIALGGCLAALVAGNTVLLKPAPETPLVARLAVEACWRAGIPRQVLQFVPTRDESASPLIADPRVSAVILTGATSTAERFLALRPTLRLFAETGGKNCAYVSALSDREQAISAVVQSAFGHAGQKCSALSVLVLEREVYESASFIAALVDATCSLRVGSAWEGSSFVTPLIHPPRGPLLEALTEREPGARWLVRPEPSRENPRLLSPGILWGVRAGSRAHLQEFFGPVLSVLCARDLAHGPELMNRSSYGLTAGFFSLDEEEQDYFLEHMDAGNLYVNRSLTGAVVGRQPFGGRKASGFGPAAKAGGPNYVAQLCTLTRKQAPGVLREDDYESWYEREFSRHHEGTTVLGEDNLSCYQPARVLLVRGQGASADDWKAALHAAKLCRAQVNTAQGSLEPALARLRFGRVRVVGTLDGSQERQLRRRPDLHVIRTPVHDSGYVELRHYLLEQARSVSFHRYGNLSLRLPKRGGPAAT